MEYVRAIPTARKFKQEMTCPLAHPGVCSRDRDVYQEIRVAGVSLVKVLLASSIHVVVEVAQAST